MAEVLSEMNIQNLDGLQQTADAIGPLLERPEEITTQTQVRNTLSHYR